MLTSSDGIKDVSPMLTSLASESDNNLSLQARALLGRVGHIGENARRATYDMAQVPPVKSEALVPVHRDAKVLTGGEET